jgi:hypothetical protein
MAPPTQAEKVSELRYKPFGEIRTYQTGANNEQKIDTYIYLIKFCLAGYMHIN